jgi:hypothetical protein
MYRRSLRLKPDIAFRSIDGIILGVNGLSMCLITGPLVAG